MSERPFSAWSGLRTTLIAFVASRALILIVAYFAINAVLVPESNRPASGLVDAFIRWDVTWYLDLARNGYTFHEDRQSNVVVFPGYPLLMHLGTLGFLSLKHSGILVSNLCTLCAGLVLWRLIRLDSDERAADLGVRFFFFNPVSFFFSIGYAEGAFILFAVAALFGARTRRWWLAGLAGYAAAITRSIGVLIVVPLLVEFWHQERALFSLRSLRSWVALGCALLPGAGTLTYMATMAVQFGDPFVYRKAEVFWAREIIPFWKLYSQPAVTTLPTFYFLWFQGALLIGIALTAAGLWIKTRSSYLVMCATYLVLHMSTGSLEAMPRYLSVVVPFYIVLGRCVALKPGLELPLTIATSVLLTFSTVLFSTGYWFT